MNYFFFVKDSNGYVHSIDNLFMTYSVKRLGTKCLDALLEEFQKLKEKYPDVNYWERLNLNPCRKYSFFQHAVHLDDGIYILLGHYSDFDKEKYEHLAFPLVRLEINPNKHANKPIFHDVMKVLNEYCYDFYMNRYDYAIDIPVAPDDVQVFGSNKEKGLYKGTRYYGQRNKNGFCRIYDKHKEQNLDTPLTRVEHVFSLTKATKNISFEKIYVKDNISADIENEKISKTDSVILELCTLASANGLEYESIIDKLPFRKKKFIKSQINQHGYKLLEFNQEVHDRLLEMVREYFNVKELITVDENGFLQIDDEDIPFD